MCFSAVGVDFCSLYCCAFWGFLVVVVVEFLHSLLLCTSRIPVQLAIGDPALAVGLD